MSESIRMRVSLTDKEPAFQALRKYQSEGEQRSAAVAMLNFAAMLISGRPEDANHASINELIAKSKSGASVENQATSTNNGPVVTSEVSAAEVEKRSPIAKLGLRLEREDYEVH